MKLTRPDFWILHLLFSSQIKQLSDLSLVAYSVTPPFCSVRNLLQCFHTVVMTTLAASTYPAWIAVISLRVSSEYRPIGELYCFLWAGLSATLPSAGLGGALQVDEQPFACTNWGFTGREQSMVGNAINNRTDKVRRWSMMSPFRWSEMFVLIKHLLVLLEHFRADLF